MHLLDLLSESLIVPSLAASDADGCIRALVRAMADEGHALPEYAEDVIRRERTFPTGLPTEPVAVAMPHADPDHLRRSCVAVGISGAGVPFGQMGTDGDVQVDARVIFLLGIKEREKQVDMIGELMDLIQNESLLASLAKARDAAAAWDLLRSQGAARTEA